MNWSNSRRCEQRQMQLIENIENEWKNHNELSLQSCFFDWSKIKFEHRTTGEAFYSEKMAKWWRVTTTIVCTFLVVTLLSFLVRNRQFVWMCCGQRKLLDLCNFVKFIGQSLTSLVCAVASMNCHSTPLSHVRCSLLLLIYIFLSLL